MSHITFARRGCLLTALAMTLITVMTLLTLHVLTPRPGDVPG